MLSVFDSIPTVNSRHRRTLEVLFAEPINGNLEWPHIEALFRALGCNVIEGSGSSVTIEKAGAKAHFHRPHPARSALRYRVKDARAFLRTIGAAPK